MTRHNRIDYIELSVTDIAAAKRFYGQAFGWQFTDYSDGYVGIKGEPHEMGGLAKVDAMPPSGGPLVIIYADDLDAALHSVTEAGGRIDTEPFGFPGGRRFHFADPSGNILAVWTTT